MKFPLFATFMVFCGWLAFILHRHKEKESSLEDTFWEKEQQANQTRKKSLDHLPYIQIPLERLLSNTALESDAFQEQVRILSELAKEKIVNLTGISNTQLKLDYGAANLPLLMRYDAQYTTLVRTLHLLATLYYDNGYLEDAQRLLEFSVETGTDMKSSYTLLLTIYKELSLTADIPTLLSHASALKSSNKDAICRMLQEYGQ